MKKILILTFALIFAITLTGCFDVERNNPFDPDSDLPDSEKMVTVEGHTYRGYSDQILPSVEITIGGKTTVSDSGGYYSIDLMPGTHNLKATKGGWTEIYYQINVQANAKATATQHEDISMFIWYEYWEAYIPNDVPQPPWGYSDGPLGDVRINDNDILELDVISNTDPTDFASVWLPNWPNKSTPIHNVLIGIRFGNTYFPETYMGLCFEDTMATPLLNIYFYYGYVYVESPIGGSKVVEYNAFNVTGRNVIVEFRVHPTNRTKGNVYFHDQNGNDIFDYANVEFSEDFNPDLLKFDVIDLGPGAVGINGNIKVLFVEFF